ncbi:MAG: peptide-methionine (S)-S-oxide reductase MsrA [Leptospirales bacterium]
MISIGSPVLSTGLFFLAGFSSCFNEPDPSGREIPEYSGITEETGSQTAVLAGGCFWGVDAVYRHVRGVTDVTTGYSGGSPNTADYESVCSGQTGHAEAVRIVYDSSIISFPTLLRIFFSVVHNPVEINRQGPDTGTQYRSAIFSTTNSQKQIAEAYIHQIDLAKTLPKPVATQVLDLIKFYPAEDYHQNFLSLHLSHPYIVTHDLPKLTLLRKRFPEFYQ